MPRSRCESADGEANSQRTPTRAGNGFEAHGPLKRSDFGMALGVPEPGTTMGVSDEVEVIIEAEFNGPPLKAASAQPAGS